MPRSAHDDDIVWSVDCGCDAGGRRLQFGFPGTTRHVLRDDAPISCRSPFDQRLPAPSHAPPVKPIVVITRPPIVSQSAPSSGRPPAQYSGAFTPRRGQQLPWNLRQQPYYSLVAPDAEEVQELGRDGVAMVKRWLEATTFMELNWNVYEDPALCIVSCLGEKIRNTPQGPKSAGARTKKFDLAGNFIGLKRSPVVVESKNYTSSSGQHKYFKEFLAIAYSSTVWEIENKHSDVSREFIWVTFHPFILKDWTILDTEGKIEEALGEFPEYLDGREIDRQILRSVSERIWILVMHKKQEGISLTHEELMDVLSTLKRKAPTL